VRSRCDEADAQVASTAARLKDGRHVDRHEALAEHITEWASRWDLDPAPSTELAREEYSFGIEIGP
jgi:hypothetical protein